MKIGHMFSADHMKLVKQKMEMAAAAFEAERTIAATAGQGGQL